MTKIWIVFDGPPHLPPTAQSPTAKRATWTSPSGKTYSVDYDGDTPTSEQIRQIAEPTQTEIAATAKAGDKARFRTASDLRILRAVAKAIIAKVPAYNWNQFLADFDAAMDDDTSIQ